MQRVWILVGALAVVALAGAADEEKPPSKCDRPAHVDYYVKQRQPGAADRKFDAIGWSRTVLDAQKLAKEHNRPVFLFTHDGRMNLGRC